MVQYDPFSDDIVHGDPHSVYAQLRAEAPVYAIERFDCWALSRFEDIWHACNDAESYSVARGTSAAHLLTKVQPVTPMLNLMDPPEHTRLRAKIRAFFSPRTARALEPDIRRFIVASLDELSERDEFDVVNDFAQPLATWVACLVSGFPPEDSDLLRGFVEAFFARDENTDGMTPEGVQALTDIVEYFTRLSAARRASGSDQLDALRILLDFESASGEKLSDEDIASHLMLFLIGGTDTLPKAFANVMYRLHEHPDQRARVVRTPSLALDAFHEALRIDMPTQFMCRSLVKDVELHGQKMLAGQPVLFLYASGNRDTAEFEAPDTFDIERRPGRTLGFGHGTHACIGLHVARAEAKIALEEILARFPEYEIRSQGVTRYQTEFVKGYASMPILTGRG